MAEYIPGLTIRVVTAEEWRSAIPAYSARHETFQDYARERWNLSRPEAYRAIDAARVVDALSPIGDAPANEAQARALAPLLRKDEGELRAAWTQAREEHGDRLTAAKLQSVTNRRLTQAAIREAQRPEPEVERVHTSNRQFDARLRQVMIETYTNAFRPFIDLERGDRAIPHLETLTPAQARKLLASAQSSRAYINRVITVLEQRASQS